MIARESENANSPLSQTIAVFYQGTLLSFILFIIICVLNYKSTNLTLAFHTNSVFHGHRRWEVYRVRSRKSVQNEINAEAQV